MAVYTQLSKPELVKLASKFGLKMNDFAPVMDGACNSNYLLETDHGPYMLTIVEERNEVEAAVLAKLLLWLEKNKYPTTRLRKTKNGGNYETYLGKAVLVKKYLKGKVHDVLNAGQIEQVGKYLGQLHSVPLPGFIPDYHYYEKPVFYSVIGKGIDVEYESWLEDRLDYFNKNLPENMPRGLVHGDLFSDNVLFEKKNLKAIIDFEEACNCFLIFDIGMTIIGLCMYGSKIIAEKARALLKGYQEIRYLEKEEMLNLQMFMEYAAVRTSSWRLWKYHIDAPNPERENKHREMMAMAEAVRDMPKEELLKIVFG